MRRLIVNADDFGFTRDVNAGIIAAHRDGILTATTLMANGDAFDDAIALAHANPSLDVGCHLVFVQGRSVADPARALPGSLKDLLFALARRDFPLYEEASAQVRRLICAGIQPSHIDTHKHTHLLPPVLRVVSRVAREFGIPWVRKPFDFTVDLRSSVATGAISVGVRVLHPWFKKTLEGLRSTDRFTGFQMTGGLDQPWLEQALRELPEGLTELMCHPGQCGPELLHAPTRLKQSRAIELAALTSDSTRRAIEDQGIELTNYRKAR